MEPGVSMSHSQESLHNFTVTFLNTAHVWITALYGSETWPLRKLERKYLESFEIWCGRRMEKIKWSEEVTNKQVHERTEEMRTLLNNILRRKADRSNFNTHKTG